MRVWLLPIVCELERLDGVRAPEQDDMREKTSDLENIPDIGDKPAIIKAQKHTPKFKARSFHAFEPVKAGRPTSWSAVSLSWNSRPKTADWL